MNKTFLSDLKGMKPKVPKDIKQKVFSITLALGLLVSSAISAPIPVFAATGSAVLSNPAVSATGVTESIAFTTTADIPANTYIGIVDGGTNIGSATAGQISTTGIPGGVINIQSAATTASGGGLGATPPNSLVFQNSGLIPLGTNVTIVVTGLTNVSTAATYSVYVGTSATYTTGQPTWDLSTSGTAVGWSGVTETISPTSGVISAEVEPSLKTIITFPTETAKLGAGQVAEEAIGISVLTNANSALVQISATPLTKVSDGKVIPVVGGTLASPITFPTNSPAWGYAIASASDPSVVPATMPTDGTKYAAFSTTPETIMQLTSPTGSTSKTLTLLVRVAPAWDTEAGLYTSTVSITVTPSYTN